MDAEHIHVFPAADLSVVQGAAGNDRLAVSLEDKEFDKAVRDEDAAIDLDLFGELFPAQGDAAGLSRPAGCFGTRLDGRGIVVGYQVDVALADRDLAVVGHEAGADFGPFGIQEQGARDTGLARRFADVLHVLLVVFMGAVREVETGDVHARLEQIADDCVIFRCRSHRTDNFGFPGKHIGPLRAAIL